MKAGKGNPHIAGTSGFYRALSLLGQGKPDEARQLATQTAEKMKRLLRDVPNLQAVRGDHDTLIVWLAYREAKDALKFDEKSGAQLLDERAPAPRGPACRAPTSASAGNQPEFALTLPPINKRHRMHARTGAVFALHMRQLGEQGCVSALSVCCE
jgi:hypothetical protein